MLTKLPLSNATDSPLPLRRGAKGEVEAGEVKPDKATN